MTRRTPSPNISGLPLCTPVPLIDFSMYSKSSEVFWWNASTDNTFSSTWHSLAFFHLLCYYLIYCIFVDTALLSHLKIDLGFQSSATATIFLAWWERERAKDLGTCLNFLSFEIVQTNWTLFWHSKGKILLSIYRNPYTSYTMACIVLEVKTGDLVIFWPCNLKLIFWS